MMNVIGTFVVLLLPVCLLPRYILLQIYRKKGKTPIIPVILSSALFWGYLFSGLMTVGVVKPLPYSVILIGSMIICYFTTISGYTEIVRERQIIASARSTESNASDKE